MNKLFGLFLFALACWAPDAAQAATRFWVGGTGTWDASDTTHWSASSGGASGASVPGASDSVTFNGSSGGGTVTVNTAGAAINILSITAGAFTGTLDFSADTAAVNIGDFVAWSGSATRTINMGTRTWTISGVGTMFDVTTTTGLTPTFSNAALVFAGAASSVRTFVGGAQTYGSLTINANSSKNVFRIQDANTFASGSVADGTNFVVAGQTFTGALNITGTSSNQSGITCASPFGTVATITVGSASTWAWTGVSCITKAGAGSITAGNSFDLGRNTSVTITAPSGGGGGGRIIGG